MRELHVRLEAVTPASVARGATGVAMRRLRVRLEMVTPRSKGGQDGHFTRSH